MFNFLTYLSYLGSANPNYTKILFTPVRLAILKKITATEGENVGKKETLYTVGGSKLIQPLWK
jgi:hypothetical protein